MRVIQMNELSVNNSELITVMKNSLYPGASDESVAMILDYCKAAGLDPMLKSVHIVPIWDSKSKLMRDVVMPGIGLYRTIAARSGQYAGVNEPVFGEDVTENIGGQQITYPKYCQITVRRLIANGQVVEFTSREFWRENYAVKGGQDKSIAPNAMWAKRPYAQIAKCAEAQALRKAFPEVGAQPTADEIQEIEINPMQEQKQIEKNPIAVKKLPILSDDDFVDKRGAWFKLIESGKKTATEILSVISTKCTLTDEQVEIIKGWKKLETTHEIDNFGDTL